MNIEKFDPNAPGQKNATIFGLPFNEENSELIIIPIPWEVTVSYRTGTAEGPKQIFDASLQVDLFDPEFENNWKKGIYLLENDPEIENKNIELRAYAEEIIEEFYEGKNIDDNKGLIEKLNKVNKGSAELNDWLYTTSKKYLENNKKIALIGGDHSTPLGYIKALSEKYNKFGVLQIDAHADLRKAFEGFTYSHASIMYNVLNEIPQVKKLVQIGIRDYCDEEYEMIKDNPDKITTFFDKNIKERQFKGENWDEIANDIIEKLPEYIYISFDIDGLDPKLCPNTGTPVPGGFELEQILYLFKKIKEKKKKIIGFDLNEVSNGGIEGDSIDTITAARIILKLSNYLLSETN